MVDWETFEAPSREPIRIVFRGSRIGADGGSAEVIGAALQRVAKLFDSLSGSEPYVKALEFGNSVTVLLQSSNEEIGRADADLQRARDVRDERGPDDDMAQQLLPKAVDDAHVAASLAGDLFSVPAPEAPARSAELGTAVARDYKSVANFFSRNGIELEVQPPDRPDPVHLTPDKAERVANELKSVSDPEEFVITVVGMLSIADAIQHGYGLRLDRDAPQPHILGTRRILKGQYLPTTGDKIREEGLWGRRVRARIRIEQDAIVSTSTIRPPTFTLIDVEPAD